MQRTAVKLTKLVNFDHAKHSFLYSNLYLAILAFVTFLSWYTFKSGLGMFILFAIGSVVLVLHDDILPVVPIIAYMIHCTAKPDILENTSEMRYMIIGLIVFIFGVIGHIIIYKPRFKLYKMTLPLTAVSIALFLGGLGTISLKAYKESLTFILTLGILMLFFYLFIMIYLRPPKDADFRHFTCYSMFSLGLVVAFQALTLMIRLDAPIDEIIRNVLTCGWGNRSTLAMTIMLSIPFNFYLALNTNRLASYGYYIISLLEYLLNYIIFARAGLIFSTLTLTASIIYTFVKGKNKSQLIYALSTVAIALGALVIIKIDSIMPMLNKIFEIIETGTSTGRIDLYIEAIGVFIQNPLLGAGVGYMGNILHVVPHGMYWFHNTVLQVAANMGIVGLICYGYWYITRGVVMFSNLSMFNILVSISILGFEAQNMMDASAFTPFPYGFIILYLTIMLEYNNGEEPRPVNINALIAE